MAKYIKIVFQNLEPVRIADDSTSQSGQTVTLRYIPGTALRGVVINTLAQESDFETVKKDLFSSKIRYMNAFPTDADQELIPSPKGFYEDKKQQEKKEMDNVVIRGEFEEGKKRAALGRFCRMEGDCIYYYNVDTGSDLRIKINDEKQNVFRHEYICANYIFTGYIALEDMGLGDRIRNVFARDFVLGNARSAGLGKCRVICCEYMDRTPYEEYLPADDLEQECYMMLLSNTVMRDENGELCGLDCRKLGEKMGVTDLEIAFCSTSTVDVKGYNRTWRTSIPSAVMYEQGSVFHLKYSGVFTREKMRAFCDQGIGIRLNEGFGRVLFLDGYENLRYKESVQFKTTSEDTVAKQQYGEDMDTLKVAARCYYRNLLERKMNAYVVENPLSRRNISNSQLGLVESLATAYKYDPQKAKKAIEQYLDHALEKEQNKNVQNFKSSIKELRQYIEGILGTKEKPVELEILLSVVTKQRDSIMGIPKSSLLTEDERLKYKLELITKMIRYDNKKEEA